MEKLVLLCVEFWTKCMRKRVYTWYMREWNGIWKFGDFKGSILCQCDCFVMCKLFSMLKCCLVCFVVRIGHVWSESSA